MLSRKTLRIVIAVVALSGFLTMLFAAGAAASRPSKVGGQEIERVLKHHELIELDAALTAQRVRESGRLSLNTSSQNFELDLTPQDMRGNGYQAEEVGADGSLRAVAMGPLRTYRGRVRGLDNAEARFSIDDEKIEGVIITPGERYYVEPVSNYVKPAQATDSLTDAASASGYLFYKGSDVIEGVHGACAATMEGKLQGEMARLATKAGEMRQQQQQQAAASIRQVELATEADYEYVNYFGSSAAANTEILNIMNQVDGVFQQQMNVSFRVVYQHTWATSADPYSATDSEGILNEFTNYWNANITHSRDLAHMWTDKSMDGGRTAGIAWTGILCSSPSYSYGVSLRVLDGLKYSIAAHEIGHNFGATHPDQEPVPVAACSGTIMNSTVGMTLSFCSFSLDQMNAYLSSNSGCLFNVATPATVQFSAPDYPASEGAGSALVTVTRTGDTSSDVTIDYNTRNGTAQDRSDYTVTSGTLRFAPGELSKTFNILITDDLYVEGQESINLSLSNPTGGAVLGGQSSATISIFDNDVVQATTNPLDGPQFFVRQHYLDFLNREPDSGGLGYWSSQLTQCGADAVCMRTRLNSVSAAFFVESEFQETGYYVYRLYKAAYGRRPLFNEFTADRSRMVATSNLDASKQALAADFVSRAAFLAQYPSSMTPEQYVDALNARTGNALTQAERDALVNGLRSGAEVRATVLLKVAENQLFRQREYNPAFVVMQYFGYLRRDPDQGGYDFWLNVLNNKEPNNFRGMVCSFITSAEYQLRFSPVSTHSNRDCSQ
jgi:hypothetical protein